MKFLVAAVAGLLLSIGAADAGSAPAAVGANPWGGLYAGINGGYGGSTRDGCWNVYSGPISDCGPAPDWATFNYNQAGALAGVQAGYNWTKGSFLFGVEVDADAANITGRLDDTLGVTINNTYYPVFDFGGVGTWKAMVTAAAKVGATSGKWLGYLEGGVAAASFDFKGNSGCNFSAGYAGPMAGAGIGYKLSHNVSLDLKYDHIWMMAGDASCTVPILGNLVDIPFQIRTQGTMDTVKLGVNFSFGG
jgi:opacity protein-like surface antigen